MFYLLFCSIILFCLFFFLSSCKILLFLFNNKSMFKFRNRIVLARFGLVLWLSLVCCCCFLMFNTSFVVVSQWNLIKSNNSNNNTELAFPITNFDRCVVYFKRSSMYIHGMGQNGQIRLRCEVNVYINCSTFVCIYVCVRASVHKSNIMKTISLNTFNVPLFALHTALCSDSHSLTFWTRIKINKKKKKKLLKMIW